jgi:hypothetical protein
MLRIGSASTISGKENFPPVFEGSYNNLHNCFELCG